MTIKEMTNLSHKEKVQQFLAQRRIAISGLSRTKDSGAGAVYLKFRDNGYQVFPLHPEAEALHGDPCYPNLSAIPGGVDAVFIMNSPDISAQIAYEAERLGIQHVWMHNNTFMGSSVSKEAVTHCREAGMNVIDAGCPMMFLNPDGFHKGMHWVANALGRMK